jgi:peptidoglycan/LPS O-acetylase OafA/YrhL
LKKILRGGKKHSLFNFLFVFLSGQKKMKNRMAESKKHVASLDILRVIAALGVCLYHYSHAISPIGSWSHGAFQYGYLGVQQFFVIAGLLVPMSLLRKNYQYADFWASLKKRFWRIEPAVWVSIGLFVLMDIIAVLTGHAHEVQPYTLIGFLLNFGHLNALLGYPWLRDIYWYLAIDWQFYLLCCMALPLISFRNRLSRYTVLIVLTIAAFLTPPSIAWLPMYLMPFAVGMALAYYFLEYQNLIETLSIVSILCATTYFHSGITHLCAVSLAALIILFARHSSAIITSLSNSSYALYLTHLVSGWTIISLIRFIKPDFNVDILVILGTLVSLVFAHYFYQKVESWLAEWVR